MPYLKEDVLMRGELKEEIARHFGAEVGGAVIALFEALGIDDKDIQRCERAISFPYVKSTVENLMRVIALSPRYSIFSIKIVDTRVLLEPGVGPALRGIVRSDSGDFDTHASDDVQFVPSASVAANAGGQRKQC